MRKVRVSSNIMVGILWVKYRGFWFADAYAFASFIPSRFIFCNDLAF